MTDLFGSAPAPPAPHPSADILAWLDRMARAVRTRDLAAGRALFAPDVVAFGTRAEMVDGLDALAALQWEPVWTSTRGFAFDLERARFEVEDGLAWAVALWSSEGVRADGGTFARAGRASFVLRRQAGRWLAVHSHYSLLPGGA